MSTTLKTRDDEQQTTNQPHPDAVETCPECGGDVQPGAGIDVACDECGLVVGRDDIDRGPEWRRFDGEVSSFERCTGGGRTPVLHDHGLGSRVGPYDNGGTGGDWQLSRIKSLNDRIERNDRELFLGLSEIQRIAGCTDAGPSVRQRASLVFRQVREEGSLVGRTIEAMAAASVWIAAREQDLPVLLRDVAEPSPVGERKIHHMMLAIRSELGIYALPPEPSAVVPRVASGCGLDPETTSGAIDLAQRLEATGEHGGRKPEGVAAACVYAAAKPEYGNDIVQDDIVDVADVSEVTMRKNLRLLESEVLDDGD